jgi:hypothetical protein
VITELLNRLGGHSGHWAVVASVGVAFLVVQLALSLRVYLRAAKQDRMLGRLWGDLERGGAGRRDPENLPWNFSWLRWVLTVFPADDARAPGNFTREEALHELDARIASDPSYLLLQRMGIMAPLLGVVLTVVGFYWLKIDETGEQSLQTILIAVTPLVAGVGTGAVLALINQGLLQVVGSRLERLRMSARTWFDAAIWRHVGLDAQAATVKGVAAMERFARELAATADRHAASSGALAESTAAIRRAAAQFDETVRSFGGELQGLPQALAVLRDAVAASAGTLQEMLPMASRATANLDVSVAAFRTTIDREFAEAARLQYRASKSMAASIEQIGDSTDMLKASAGEMTHAAAASAASLKRCDESLSGAAGQLGGASERLRRTIESDMAPAQRSLFAAAASMQQSAEQLSAFVAAGLGPAAQDLAALHETLSRLEGTVAAINKLSQSRADIDRLTEALGRAAEISEAISALPEQIRGILEETASRDGEPEPEPQPARMPWLLKRPR